MEIQLGYTPNDLLVFIWSLVKKFFIRVGSGRKYYLIIIVSLVVLYILYTYLFKFLTNYFSKDEEN